MNSPHDSLLGKPIDYPDRYDPDLLFPIARATQRAAIGVGDALPFNGVDIWNAYEVSWLDARGKPVVALAEFRVPAESPNLVESKSFKLYLNSYNQERIDNAVPRLGIEHQLEWLARFLKLVCELNRVLHVNVVVNHAVN